LPLVTTLPVFGLMTLAVTFTAEPYEIVRWLTDSLTLALVAEAFAATGSGAASAADASTGPAMS
jgi:hypothetical protein